MMNTKRIYWVSTILLCLMMGISAITYFTVDAIKASVTALGFPDYFRVELGVAKLIGVAVLLIPSFKSWMKEWAYAGFAIIIVSAVVSFIGTGGGEMANYISVAIGLALLYVSHDTYLKIKKND